MAVTDAVQTLWAAFSFGFLLHAAAGACYRYSKGHDSTLFKDGRRLVLILFLLFAALWAQVEFFNLLTAETASTCQLTIVVSAVFDQLARSGIEQFLLWSAGSGAKITAGRLILQGILFLRLVGGMVFVGFMKPQFAPVCVAQTSIIAVPIVVIVLDVIIFGVLLTRALSLRNAQDTTNKQSDLKQEQIRSLIFCVLGLGVWTGASIPKILGLPAMILILRTALPAHGLLLLIGIVAKFSGRLLVAHEVNSITPEARSPFVDSMPPSRELFQENSGSNGSPVSNQRITSNGNLFVVNPCAASTPSLEPFQGTSRRDTTGHTELRNEGNVRETSTPSERSSHKYRGSSGVFPSTTTSLQSVCHGSLAPQIRSNSPERFQTTPKSLQSSSSPAPKRSMFNWSKSADKVRVRSLGISQPVLSPSTFSQSSASVSTVDLGTAASIEQERRDEAFAISKLVASRPAPHPPRLSTRNVPSKGTNVEQKERPSDRTEQMEPISIVPGVSSVGISKSATDGTATSSSFSPGREEVHRRSPVQTKNIGQSFDINTHRPTIQKKNTNWLPSNAQAGRMTVHHRVNVPTPQTVMLINDIVYDNPDMVKKIETEAPGAYPSTPQSKIMDQSSFFITTGSRKHTDSIIHRPRPYKRDTKGSDRTWFLSRPSPRHIRSKSASTTLGRPSLKSLPGSPTQLSPLPALPLTAYPKKILPDEAESMTIGEKIDFLFPTPSGADMTRRRTSSVPSLPRIPSIILPEALIVLGVNDFQDRIEEASDRLTIASSIAPSIPPRSPRRETVHLSPFGDQVEENRFISSPESDLVTTSHRHSFLSDKRMPYEAEVTSDDVNFSNDSTTYWVPIRSAIPSASLSGAKENANFTHLQSPISYEELSEDDAVVPVMLDSRGEYRPSSSTISAASRQSFLSDKRRSSIIDRDHTAAKKEHGWHCRIGDDLPTFSDRSRSRSVNRKMPPPKPLLLNGSKKKAAVVVRHAEPSPPADFPERAIADIQEQLKRFEERPSRGSVDSLIRRIPGPSDENQRAPDSSRFRLLENIENEMEQQEDQWQQMQTNLDSDSVSASTSPYTQAESEKCLFRMSSVGSSLGSLNTPFLTSSRRSRIRSTMGIRSKYRCSRSTPPPNNRSRASMWQQRLAEAQMEYMENASDLLNRSLSFLPVSKGNTPMTSPTPSDREGSAVEVETDSESDSEVEAMEQDQAPRNSHIEAATLWQPSIVPPKAATGHLWMSPGMNISFLSVTPEPPAKRVRPAQRRSERALPIFSTELWAKSAPLDYRRPAVGLWGPKTSRPISLKSRPTTMRPQRMSKRMSLLPDIIESPVPLPNKEDMLGIFQFAWGETSDQPVNRLGFEHVLPVDPVPSVIDPMFTVESQQFEPVRSEFTSFFDDDEEEDSDMDYSLSGEEHSDVDCSVSEDEFDESTLQRIATLLRSSEVPSRNSLLPAARAQAIFDYDDDSGLQSPESATSPSISDLPIQPLAVLPRATAQLWTGVTLPSEDAVWYSSTRPETAPWDRLVSSTDDFIRPKPRFSQALPTLSSADLWVMPAAEVSSAPASSMWSNATTHRSSISAVAVASSPSKTWSPPRIVSDDRKSGMFTIPSSIIRTTDAAPAAANLAKTARPLTGSVPTIFSNNLWAPLESRETITSRLWMSTATEKAQPQQILPTMWSQPSTHEENITPSLFDVSVPRLDYRSSDDLPAAISMVCKPRKSTENSVTLTSTRMWSGNGKQEIETDWISMSSTRSEPPSVHSTPSPCDTSPALEVSSVFSANVEASSILSTDDSEPPREDEGAKNSTIKLLEDDAKHPSKTSVRQPPQSPSPPVQESKIMASRDLWEPKTPAPEKFPAVKKFQKGLAPQSDSLSALKLKLQRKHLIHSVAAWNEALAEAVAASLPRKESIPRPVASHKRREATSAEAANKKISVPRPVASKPHLEAPLAKAVPTSAPRLRRPATNKSDWESALFRAIYLSKSRVAYSPEMWKAALTEAINSSTTTPVARQIVHKATLWRPSAMASISEPTAMWSSSGVRPRALAVEVKLSDEPPRKIRVFRAADLQTLESRSLWTPEPIVEEKNTWLSSGAKKFFAQTWTPRAVLDMEENIDGLWVAKRASTLSVPDMFADVEHGRVKVAPASSQHVTLPRLNSTELFASGSVSVLEKSKHWLRETSVQISPIQLCKTSTEAQMWTPRILSPESENASLWIAKTVPALSMPDLFADVKHSRVKVAPNSNQLGALSSLKSTQLFTLGSAGISEERKHWLQETSVQLHKTSTSNSVPLWALRVLTPKPENTGLWVAENMPSCSSPNIFANTQSQMVKRAPLSSTSVLPELSSNELFQLDSASGLEQDVHWLHKTCAVKPAFQTWVPSNILVENSAGSAAMWAMQHLTLPSAPDMFAHIKGQRTERPAPGRPLSLQRLSSSELFTVGSVEINERTNWLQATSAIVAAEVTPTVVDRPLTWSAPRQDPVTKEEGSMWHSRPSSAQISPAMLQDMTSDPWRRNRRSSEPLRGIESTDLWFSSEEVPDILKDWIMSLAQ